ncbi:MAG TPA: hypothetical protein VI703_10635 [Anaerolineales bacterium]|jgi:hypothetical protein|nr:hypothetical protein [Anaerolineales bacterium]
MDIERRSNIAFGLILFLIGGFFLAAQFFPQLSEIVRVDYAWPFWVVGVGLIFLIMAVAVRAPGLAVPASIISGIGGILYYQNSTGAWETWAYAWTLIPGFVGVGIIIMNFLEGRFVRGLREGFGPILVSLVMFGIFGSFLGGPAALRQLWPLLLIGLGVWIMLKGRLRMHRDVEVIKRDGEE